MAMTIDEPGFAFIKKQEIGTSTTTNISKAYTVGSDTVIGIGHSVAGDPGFAKIANIIGRPFDLNGVLSPPEIFLVFKSDVREREPQLNSALGGATVTQNQYNACMDLLYQIGSGGFSSSGVPALIKSGKITEAANKIKNYTFVGQLPGDPIRRAAEAALFLGGVQDTYRDFITSKTVTGGNVQINHIKELQEALRSGYKKDRQDSLKVIELVKGLDKVSQLNWGQFSYTSAGGSGKFTYPVSGKKYPILSPVSVARVHPALGITRAHEGVDIGTPSGTPLVASFDGIIEFAGLAPTLKSGYGNFISIRAATNFPAREGTPIFINYGHLSEIHVTTGQRVKAGSQIGLSGATGLVTGPHLHFEIRVGSIKGGVINPERYF